MCLCSFKFNVDDNLIIGITIFFLIVGINIKIELQYV